jgi:hypothetical protein
MFGEAWYTPNRRVPAVRSAFVMPPEAFFEVVSFGIAKDRMRRR